MKCLLVVFLIAAGSMALAETELGYNFVGFEIKGPILNGKRFAADTEAASFVCSSLVPNYIYAEITETKPYSVDELGLNTVNSVSTPNGNKFVVSHWQGLDQTPVITEVMCFYNR